MFQACRRRNPEVKRVKRVDLRAIYFLRRLQKSGPTQTDLEVEYFYTVDEKTGYILIILRPKTMKHFPTFSEKWKSIENLFFEKIK